MLKCFALSIRNPRSEPHQIGVVFALLAILELQRRDRNRRQGRNAANHACDGIKVKDVLRAVPQSRTLLESRFKRILGRTPHEEILRVRCNFFGLP